MGGSVRMPGSTSLSTPAGDQANTRNDLRALWLQIDPGYARRKPGTTGHGFRDLSRLDLTPRPEKTHAKTQRRKGLKIEYEKFSACWRLEVSFVRRRPFHRKAFG